MDYLRIICAFAIVILHVTSASLTYSSDASHLQTIAMHLSTIFTSWAVPCFFMITGFFWLGNDKNCTYKSVSKHILKFVLVLFTLGLFYAFLELVFNTGGIEISLIILAIKNVFIGKLWDHMWYVYAVIGVYLMLPLIKPFFTRSTKKDDVVVLLMCFGFTILLPYVEAVFQFSFPIKFSASGWLVYVIFGGLVAKYKDSFNNKKIIFISIIMIVLSSIAISIKYYFEPSFHVVDYKSLSICLISSSVFLLTVYVKQYEREYKFFTQLSSCCWGIYLIHPLFLNLMFKFIKINPLDYVWFILVPITCIIVFALCAFVVWLLRKIPIIQKFIF